MSLPRYPEYKDSGVEWLGDVPNHWQVMKLKFACEVFPSNVDKKSSDNEIPVSLCNYTDVYYNEAITSNLEFMAATATEAQIAKFVLKSGDTIITKDSETADDIAIAAYVPEDLHGVICGYHLSMVRPRRKEVVGAFVKRLFDSSYTKSCFAVLANGLTRVGLGQYALDNVVLPFPPSVEQTAITTFLDRETAKIDGLIAEQEKLITLLAEKRQATISHVVTKGLNPDAPMKDSGVTWLGEVPAHWSCRKLSWLTEKIGDGLHGTPNYVDESEYFFINGNNLVGGSIVVNDNTRNISQQECLSQAIALDQTSVLLSINGTIGNFALYNGEKVMLGKSAAYLNCSDRLDRRYLAYFLQSDSCKSYFFNSLTGTTIHNLSLETIRASRVPLPSLEEQATIICALDAEIIRLDALTVEATRGIALLKERRSALISAAVTGKIDVRNHAQNNELRRKT